MACNCNSAYESLFNEILTTDAKLIKKILMQDSFGTSKTHEKEIKFKCRITEDKKPSDEEKANRNVAVSYWNMLFPLSMGEEITPDDKVIINGFEYEVIDSNYGRSEAFVLSAYLKRNRK